MPVLAYDAGPKKPITVKAMSPSFVALAIVNLAVALLALLGLGSGFLSAAPRANAKSFKEFAPTLKAMPPARAADALKFEVQMSQFFASDRFTRRPDIPRPV